MRFHLIALAHTQTLRSYSNCAFTSLAIGMSEILTDLGHEVIVYGGEGNDARCFEHVQCISREEQKRLCKVDGPASVLAASWEPQAAHWALFVARATEAVRHRISNSDIILLSAGWSLSRLIEAFPEHTRCEYAVGYTGWHEQTHRVLPSYAWQHALMGKWYGSHGTRGRFSDRVIPHWVDPGQFKLKEKAGGKYFLFIGRLQEDKGVGIAIDTAKALDMPLVVAGQGQYPLPEWVNRTGLVGSEHRASLMAGAAAVFAPSMYLEPFGLVAIEAQMAGCPAITTDWGAFPETVEDGVTGRRCNTAEGFMTAGREAMDGRFEPGLIRAKAIERFSPAAIGPRYVRFFEELMATRMKAPVFLPPKAPVFLPVKAVLPPSRVVRLPEEIATRPTSRGSTGPFPGETGMLDSLSRGMRILQSGLPTDSENYEVITHGVYQTRGIPGLTCEIGLRRGGGTKCIVDALFESEQRKTHIAIDPYGNIDYEDSDTRTVKHDYTNEMRDSCLINLYAYAHSLKQNVLFFCLDDVEFFTRYADGVPVYDERKRIEKLYSFVHFDGPHSVKALLAELAFFESRTPAGAVFVFDDVANYEHKAIDDRLIHLEWNRLQTSPRKWSYVKT